MNVIDINSAYAQNKKLVSELNELFKTNKNIKYQLLRLCDDYDVAKDEQEDSTFQAIADIGGYIIYPFALLASPFVKLYHYFNGSDTDKKEDLNSLSDNVRDCLLEGEDLANEKDAVLFNPAVISSFELYTKKIQEFRITVDQNQDDEGYQKVIQELLVGTCDLESERRENLLYFKACLEGSINLMKIVTY